MREHLLYVTEYQPRLALAEQRAEKAEAKVKTLEDILSSYRGTYTAEKEIREKAEADRDRLLAMLREPTEEMIRAGTIADSDFSNNRFHGQGQLSRVEFIFKAMTAAMKGG